MKRELLQLALDAWDYQRNDHVNMGFIFENIRHALTQPEQSATVYIQSDHLLNAMQAPFLCRVEPTQRLPDFVPMYAAQPGTAGDKS
jgi:hypothetical protein